MIVERDIGRLAKYTFDMGGAGDLLSLSLNVPPWEDLHELSRAELRLTNLVTTDAVAEVLPQADDRQSRRWPSWRAKPVQDRFVSSAARRRDSPQAGEIHQDGGSGGSDRRRRGDGAGEVAAINPEYELVIPGTRLIRNPRLRRYRLEIPAYCAGARFPDMTMVCVDPCADAGCFALASIWPMASTTASKVSMVEACRAL